MLGFCFARNIRPVISRRESCNIYYVRNMCLGADVSRGAAQKPFDGKLAYDYLMWIDSDVLFDPGQFARLLSHNADIVSGLYLMEGGRNFAAVEKWDEEFFKKNGFFNFLTPQEVEGRGGLLEVAYNGMGFMLVKRGVFESLDYPWFRPIEKKIGDMVDLNLPAASCGESSIGWVARIAYNALANPGASSGECARYACSPWRMSRSV
jgi:hypothetical protein